MRSDVVASAVPANSSGRLSPRMKNPSCVGSYRNSAGTMNAVGLMPFHFTFPKSPMRSKPTTLSLLSSPLQARLSASEGMMRGGCDMSRVRRAPSFVAL